MKIEIAVQDLTGTRIAYRAGVDRVELCSSLAVYGGLTPSIALVRACAEVGVPVHPLIRTRPGGFCYTPEEIGVMAADVAAAVDAGAAGVVVGALDSSGGVDAAAVRLFVEAAAGAEVTFHRAIDVVADKLGALETLIDLGVTRVLTSGGAPSANDAIEVLAELVSAAADRIQIQAGGGVTLAGIEAIRGAGVDAIHLSARTVHQDPNPSGPGGGQAEYDVTDATLVESAVAAVRRSDA